MKSKSAAVLKIKQAIESATPEQYAAGVSWYERANWRVTQLAKAYGVTPSEAAKVVAILSPAVKWERNLKDAELLLGFRNTSPELLAGLPFGTYKANVLKAQRVLAGLEDLTPKSKKTWAFFNNIMLNDSGEVTVDRHAYTAVTGARRKAKTLKAGGSVSVGKKAYHQIESAYASVANDMGLTPYQVQAIVWEVERSNKKSNKGIK